MPVAFSYQPLPKGKKVAIITNAGGPGIMATDACEKSNILLTSLSKETIDKLKNFYRKRQIFIIQLMCWEMHWQIGIE